MHNALFTEYIIHLSQPQTDARGTVTKFAYDELDRVTAITDPLGGQTAFTYDPNGNLLTATHALNHTLTHEYDSMGPSPHRPTRPERSNPSFPPLNLC